MITFITGNGWKHAEAKRLLSGLDVAWARLTLTKPDSELLEEVASARVRDGFRQLGSPCFVENTSLALDSQHFTGAQFKRALKELGEAGFASRYGGARGLTRVVLAYTADGVQVQIFEGQIEGELLKVPRGAGGYGWDRLWVPEGYRQTLAELAESKDVVNMRQAPFIELASMVRGDAVGGIFESHVTVAVCDPVAFAAQCEALKVKCLWIEQTGERPVQPMTASFHHGVFRDAMFSMQAQAQHLARAGFSVLRMKLEAVGRHRDVPQTDAEASRTPKSNYFEHHANVGLLPGTDEVELAEACRALGAHFSRNARKVDVAERFVTMRSYGVGQLTANARFEPVLALFDSRGLPVRNKVREYTVYDSALEVDRGWMAS